MVTKSHMSEKANIINILFPGRHHMLTKFQQQYLRNAIKTNVNGNKIGRIIFAVTSANHENTRRNPIPLYLRCMAIDKFASDLGCDFKIYPIPDIHSSDKFAEFIIRQIYYQSGEEINPENTIVACSTPNVIKLFDQLGFINLPVELVDISQNTHSALRPYEVIDLLVASGSSWRNDAQWREYASLATQNIYDKYNIGDTIVELFRDAILTEDAEITETRDYNTYALAMDNIINIKFEDIEPFIVQGKIVDVGCSTGSLVRLLAREFQESDIIGIEATRKFYEFCKSQEYPSPYVFFYRRNITDQNFKPHSINTFIYSSILHEVYSYIGESALLKVLTDALDQLEVGGRVVIRDVVGPENPDMEIYMELNDTDGTREGMVSKLSTYAIFFRFVQDFLPRKISFTEEVVGDKTLIKLRLQDAYEFMSKKNYTDNWQSEMHEEFGFYSFSQWQETLKGMGYHIVSGSRSFKNQYIIDHGYKGKVSLYVKQNGALVPAEYPDTNMILVGEKVFA